jgi:hypothetical protein
MVGGIDESRGRSRCSSWCRFTSGRGWCGTRSPFSWGRLLDSGILLWVKRRCSRGIFGLLGLLLLELAGLGNKRACRGDVINGVTDCTRGTKVGDDRGVLSLWRISRIRVLGL